MSNPWAWTRFFTVGLTIFVAAFCAWGALAPHIRALASMAPLATGVLMAGLYGNAQGLANCMAANMRRAWVAGDGYRAPAVFFFVCFIVFALTAMSGLHSAWAFARAHAGGAPLPDDQLMQWLFACIAFSEPAMNYGVEALKALQYQQQRAEEREALSDAADRDARRQEAEARRKALHVVAPMAVATVAAASMPAEAATLPRQSPPQFPLATAVHAAPANAMAEAHAARGWSGPRDPTKWQRFLEATELGMTPMAIVREVGIPSSTTYRWRRILAARP